MKSNLVTKTRLIDTYHSKIELDQLKLKQKEQTSYRIIDEKVSSTIIDTFAKVKGINILSVEEHTKMIRAFKEQKEVNEILYGSDLPQNSQSKFLVLVEKEKTFLDKLSQINDALLRVKIFSIIDFFKRNDSRKSTLLQNSHLPKLVPIIDLFSNDRIEKTHQLMLVSLRAVERLENRTEEELHKKFDTVVTKLKSSEVQFDHVLLSLKQMRKTLQNFIKLKDYSFNERIIILCKLYQQTL